MKRFGHPVVQNKAVSRGDKIHSLKIHQKILKDTTLNMNYFCFLQFMWRKVPLIQHIS